MSSPDLRNRRSRAEQRAETRRRLLDSATALFAARGIAATSVEEIAEAAGYTRGAFYSNFRDKDELVLALVDAHVERNVEQFTTLAERDPSGAELLQQLTDDSADRSDEAMDRVVLNMEFWLYAVRNPANRARLSAIQHTLRDAITEIVEARARALGLELPLPSERAAQVVLALGDGLAFHTLIEPDAYPPGLFATTLVDLQRAITALARERAAGSAR